MILLAIYTVFLFLRKHIIYVSAAQQNTNSSVIINDYGISILRNIR